MTARSETSIGAALGPAVTPVPDGAAAIAPHEQGSKSEGARTRGSRGVGSRAEHREQIASRATAVQEELRAAQRQRVENTSLSGICRAPTSTFAVVSISYSGGKGAAMANAQMDRRPSDDIEARQLERLARSILDQPAGDLAEVMRANPALVREWIAEMRSRREALEAEASTLTKALHKVLRTHPATGVAVA